MDLQGEELFYYQILEGYGKNASKFDREDPVFEGWVREIKRNAPHVWIKAKETYDVFKDW